MESNSDCEEEQFISFKPQHTSSKTKMKEKYQNFVSGRSTKKSHKKMHFSKEKKVGSSHDNEYFKESDKEDRDSDTDKANQESYFECDSNEDNQDLQFETDEMGPSFNNKEQDCRKSKSKKQKYQEAFESDGEEEYNKKLKSEEGKDKGNYPKYTASKNEEEIYTKTAISTLDGGDKAQRMMRKMGYQPGKGLGRNEQGRLEPVEASKQHGRSGIGHRIPGLADASIKWDPAEEEIKVVEDMNWLRNRHSRAPTVEDMKNWMVLGPKKETLDDEVTFCDPEIISNVIGSKSVFDNLDKVQLLRARTRSNPYETIRGAFFLNRAAVKMANIDKACNFMFTSPKGHKESELLYFADVCAGPGGFSEYVLWRKKWHAKGYGFTLKNQNDFRLDDFYAGSCETFHPFYGPKDNGDVYDVENQKAFKNMIMQDTNGEGVHFMMADGGFSVDGQENIQEILSKQLYLCQCLVALMIVRTGGNFVTKLFDLFTPFSAGLIYLMYRCFDEICIFKPNSSRPANSERYLICKGKRRDTRDVENYLHKANCKILQKDDNNDVMQLVPLAELEVEEHFMQYLKESNNYLGRKQITGLLKIAAFCEDNTLIEPMQAVMRTQCLESWKIPDEARTRRGNVKPRDKLKLLLKGDAKFLSHKPVELTKENIKTNILNQPYDWFCLPCSTGKCTDEQFMATFYLSMGRRNVYRLVNGNWISLCDSKLELPPDTLIYAEMTFECVREGKYQVKVPVLHIVDAYMLGAEDISRKYIEKRYELIKKFCKALWKPAPPDFYTPVRAKNLFSLQIRIDKTLKVTSRVMKNNRVALGYNLTSTLFDCEKNHEETRYFIPNSVLFLKSTAAPWHRHLSQKNNLTYVYNQDTSRSEYDDRRPPTAEAGFIEAFENRVVWYWPQDDALSIDYVVQCIAEKCPELS